MGSSCTRVSMEGGSDKVSSNGVETKRFLVGFEGVVVGSEFSVKGRKCCIQVKGEGITLDFPLDWILDGVYLM